MELQKNVIEQYLVDEWHYKPQQVKQTVQELFSMDSQIFDAFAVWIKIGEFNDFPQFSEWTPLKIRIAYPFMKPPAVFLLLDWIRREPKSALFALEQEFGKPSCSSL